MVCESDPVKLCISWTERLGSKSWEIAFQPVQRLKLTLPVVFGLVNDDERTGASLLCGEVGRPVTVQVGQVKFGGIYRCVNISKRRVQRRQSQALFSSVQSLDSRERASSV